MVILEYNLLMCAPCKGRIIPTMHWQFYTFLPGYCQRKGIFIEFHNTQLPGGGISMKWLAMWFFSCFFGCWSLYVRRWRERNPLLYQFEYIKNEYIMLLGNSWEIFFYKTLWYLHLLDHNDYNTHSKFHLFEKQ